MSYNVVLVGAGPTAIYTLQALLASDQLPSAVTIFERQRRAGQGTPYSANWSDPIMLANIASIEIPPLPQSLVDWLRGESDSRLATFGMTRADIDDRAFYPRLVVGEYLAAQFLALVERAHTMNVPVDVRTRSTVIDIEILSNQIGVTASDPRGKETKERFDYAILATGHQWPSDPEIRPGYFTSPWPATALTRIHNCAVGIRGTSLSAIDAAVVIANQHGEFVETQVGTLQYQENPTTRDYSITMFSRKGILPEADFFHPIPYEPLEVCNAEAMQALIDRSEAAGLLDASFELFRKQLLLSDAKYASSLGLSTKDLEGFSDAYFEARERADPFTWAQKNLKESVANLERGVTVPWRYAILRMHEVFDLLVQHLNDVDFVRFSNTLKPVFVDNYATVPHESIKRLLALHAAGRLTVKKLDDTVRLDTHAPNGGATIKYGQSRFHFPVFIEATGQKMLSAKDFPFPSLRRQGVIQDLKADAGNDAHRGIAIDGIFHPISAFENSERLFCLSLPFLLGQHPFAQGITNSAENASVVAKAIAEAVRLSRDGRAPCRPELNSAG